MAQNGYELLINDQTVYPVQIVERTRNTSKHWINATWLNRERDLRHDLICCLLCNLEVKEGVQDALLKVLRKETDSAIKRAVGPEKRKEESDTDSEEEGASAVLVEYASSDSSESEFEDGDTDDEEYYVPEESENVYRYVVIEGTMDEPKVQAHYCKVLGIPKRRKLYDIVDKRAKKLIEVKVTSNPSGRVDEFNKNADTDNNVGLCCVNYRKMSFTYVNCERLPGESKVLSFLVTRATRMAAYGIVDSNIAEETNLQDAIFNITSINDYMDKEAMCMETKTNKVTPPNFENEEGKLSIITPKLLFDNLIKPKEIDGPPIRWKGKLTPHLNFSIMTLN